MVLELECLESEQWQQQIRSFQAGQPGGAAGNESLGQSMHTYVRLYGSIYIAYKSVYIVYTFDAYINLLGLWIWLWIMVFIEFELWSTILYLLFMDA